jgi:CHAT domain-containing protein
VKEHPNYATSLNNLGYLYQQLGDYAQAEPYYLEAKNIMEKTLEKDHSGYATLLNNLGLLYLEMGYSAKAEPYYLEAKNIREKTLGKEHSAYVNSLHNLGALYNKTGDYAQAESYYLEAKNIMGKTLGKEYPEYAPFLHNLGYLYDEMGDYAQAESYYLEAKNIMEKTLEKDHPYYAGTLTNLLTLYLSAKNYPQASLFASKADQFLTSQINQNFTFLSEQQRNAFWNKNKNRFDGSFSLSYLYPVPKTIEQAYNNTLFTKGLLLRTNNEIRDAILTSGNQNLIRQFEGLHALRQQIIALHAQQEPKTAYIASLESRADSLDKVLTQASQAYRDAKADIALQWQDIQAQLQANEAAIEFVHFNFYNKKQTDSVLYAALILKKGAPAPIWVPLFEKSQLEALLADENDDTGKRITKLYTSGNPRFYNGQKLYQLVWQPLEQYLSGIKSVYYSPSGALNQISFAAIPADTFLLTDQYKLHLVSSTREIVRMKTKKTAFLPVTKAVEYGGIFYDVENPQDLISLAKHYKPDETNYFASRSLSKDTRSGWSFLQGTEEEVIEIEGILTKAKIPNVKYMGIAANEESFKNMSGQSPELLHIATHGFFLEDEKAIRETGFMQMMNHQKSTYINPLLRSGLLLAGANRAWKNEEVIPDIEDGILTAEEIAHLNLSKTKLVVLSACETGLGEVQNSEGVFGLQRAFKLAGVETLVMSLWKVDDAATSEFMILFYKNLMAGKTKIESFKTAQQAIRTEYKNPYYWAGFVMMD